MRIVFVVILCLISKCSAQTTQNLIILYVNEKGNDIAEESVDVALAYIKKNNKLGINANVRRVSGNRTDSAELLESLCNVYNEMLKQSEYPHLVLDTTMTDVASETVKSFTKALGLPTISASFGQQGDLREWRNINEDERKYLIQISPPADLIPEIIRQIVLKQSITNAAILFDSSFVMDHKYKSLLQNVATRHLITAIDFPRLEAQLHRLRSLDLTNYFVLGSLESIKLVLEAAEKNSYVTRMFAWHVITQDMGELKCNLKNGSILFIKPMVNPDFQNRFGQIMTSYQLTAKPEIVAAFYFDFTLQALLTIKQMLTDGSWKKTTVSNFITCDEYDERNTPIRVGLDVQEALENQLNSSSELPTFGQMNIISNGLSKMQFEMTMSLVRVRDGAADKTTPVGTWIAGLNSNLTFVDSQIISNFTAALVYRVVIVEQVPFIFRDENHPKGYNGYCIDLMDKIAEVLRFEYEIVLATGNVFGYMDDKGKWNGLIKDLMEKKADIGLGSISVMAERENVIDFTVPYYDLVGITILMKVPSVPTSLFKFLTVLENEVWYCILGAYFFTSVLLWLFDRWSPYSYQNNREKYKDDEEKREFYLKECLWFCMTSLTPQGGGEAPKNLSGRLVAATWWLFGFIIIASYTANLAAFLTVSRLETPIESLDDLSKQYKIQYAPMNGSATSTYFERMANIEGRFYEIWKEMSLNDSLNDVERAKLAVWDYPVSDKYTKMWQAMKEAGFPKTLREAAERVRESKSSSEGFAYLGDATDIKYLEMTNCDLKPVGEEFSRKPYALAVQQGSPLKDQLNTAILQLLNRRELERLKDRWWTRNPNKVVCDVHENQSDGISIQNIGGVFIVIFVGIGLACITLAFEYWWYKCRKTGNIVTVMEALDSDKPPKTSFGEGFGKTKFDKDKFNEETFGKNLTKDKENAPVEPTKLYRGMHY